MRAAGKGTLFLDEIGNLTPPLQLKLLRALESGEVRPVGADQSFAAPFRLVAATNTDLEGAVRQGRFRSDLLHRLKGGLIALPPLCEHMQDLEALVSYLLEGLCKQADRTVPDLSPSLWEQLHRHDWPGNVRELRMALQAALAMNPADILGLSDFSNLPESARRSPARRGPAGSRLPGETETTLSAAGIDIPDALEGRMILRTLAQNEWDKTATARQIGWSRQKLYRVMKKYGIPNRVTEEQVRSVQGCLQTLTMSIDAPPASSTRQ